METQTESNTTQQTILSNSNSAMECSQEFKLEMENSICNYFSKCNFDDDQSLKSNIARNETLIDNTTKDIEYIIPTSSLNGISDFMIDQIFSTDKIIPVESDDEESKLEETEATKANNVDDTTKPTSENKMSSCNSDVTLSNNVEDLDKEEEEEENIDDDGNISKSFAVEFIDLLNINMKELNSKKDDFHVIGLKKIEEEKEIPETILPSTNEIKFKEETIEEKPKSSKKSKHISIFNLDKKPSVHLYRSKSTSTPKSSSKGLSDSMESLNKEVKKSKSKLGLSKIFKTVKKRMTQKA